MFSIVIPSKNEEIHIGTLLKSIREQTIQPHKIVLSDKSSDHTREIARGFDVEIIDGQDDGLIGRARNKGAARINDDIIIFLDADTELYTCTFLEDVLTCFQAMDLDVGSCYYKPKHLNWKSFLMFHGINFVKWLDSFFKLGITTGGGFIIVKRKVFNSIEGFSETRKLSEDVEMVWRLTRAHYRFGVIPNWIYVSSRRFTDTSVPTILATIVGGAGSVIAIALNTPFLTRLKDTFENLYGETGGTEKE